MRRLEECKVQYIKGFTFGFMAPRGAFEDQRSKESVKTLIENTASNCVILAIGALQDTAQSTTIHYNGQHIVSDEELIDMIYYIQSLGAKVILKPLVNVSDGTWRAHINFFDVDVPCEPKWSEWFESYTAYQVHYAKIAQRTGCEMMVVGCEMVQSNHRSMEWREVIHQVRKHYNGLVTYNADKYQEDRIDWWDALDVISSSGYYPSGSWPVQLNRIEKLVKHYDKPFFFVEAGCMSTQAASVVPNDWTTEGVVDLMEQAKYYDEMFRETRKKSFVEGFGLWDWSWDIYPLDRASKDGGYNVYGKPAEKVILDFYSNS